MPQGPDRQMQTDGYLHRASPLPCHIGNPSPKSGCCEQTLEDPATHPINASNSQSRDNSPVRLDPIVIITDSDQRIYQAICFGKSLTVDISAFSLRMHLAKLSLSFGQLQASADLRLTAEAGRDNSDDFEWLERSLAAESAVGQQRLQRVAMASEEQAKRAQRSGGGWRLCAGLRHYQRQQGRQQCATQASFISFGNRRFADAGDFATSLPDMHVEANRLASFAAQFAPGVAQQLSAAGWFSSEPGSLRCAFCHGRVLADAAVAAVADAGSDNGAMRLHRDRFATCPMVLGLDVGNVPSAPTAADDGTLRPPVACSEGAEDFDWRPEAAATEAEGARQLRLRPGLPVALAVARAACDPGAERNLDMLERSLPSGGRDAAAAVRPMRYPGMSEPDVRLATLASVASATAAAAPPVPLDLLASAGFFAVADCATAVACHWCGARLDHWLPSDDPWVEHARWSPRCCHLLREMGADFVLAARRVNPPYLPAGVAASGPTEVPAEVTPALVTSPTEAPAAAVLDFRMEPRQLRAREDAAGAALTQRLLRAADDGADDLRTALTERLRTVGDDFPSDQVLLASALDVRKRRRVLGLGAAQFLARRTAELEARRSVEAKPFVGEDINWQVCKVCMDRVINVTLWDCGHHCCCSNCARSLDSCPVCRAPIRGTLLFRGEQD